MKEKNKSKRSIVIVSILIITGLFFFFWPKEMEDYGGLLFYDKCFGKQVYLEDLNNPFSIIPEDLVERIEIESLYRACFGLVAKKLTVAANR